MNSNNKSNKIDNFFRGLNFFFAFIYLEFNLKFIINFPPQDVYIEPKVTEIKY